ncbi:hypothetical protein [Conexibacter sp. DBS9H8]|uniref:hypothetical protein n=1 Tax=Conexibacter sp. DBS9H8 TaxID=2937801 RepID=UPI00200C4448|nr:hypothetical protein [Conexibacter sp. DBS9H8]
MSLPDRIRVLLEEGLSYPSVADRLGISPGLAFLLATGRPVDDGTSGTTEGLCRSPTPSASPRELSPQELIGAGASVPERHSEILEWVAARAARELTSPHA